MTTNINFSDAAILDPQQGVLSAKHERIAEIIRDYDPNLELAWIPPDSRTAFDREPFAIIHNNPQGGRYVVGYFREDQMNHQIIAHLFKINNANRNVLTDLEAEEAAHKALEYKTLMDEQAEREEFAKSLIKTRKHRYRHNGKVYE
jgi:hypothetical protein